MHATALRQSFLDFFASKGHTLVPSASLMPTAPNLLFTNAGMNPFVPYFLGEQKAPYVRIADTQKCIRAGGKHNDLEDVGFDTYHHTFFEMLGNWSIGDYFKKEAIEWAWELLTVVWKFPKERLYATVYKPEVGDPATFDQESYDVWKAIFEREGLDPYIHICMGNRKDNFWMMGETGPCGPCTEIHVDLTPKGDTRGSLVNSGAVECLEIWNLVFISLNAQVDGTFQPLATTNVDTGMGFERVSGILATTRNFTDFSRTPSNYDSDLFAGIFEWIMAASGHQYQATVPKNRDQLSVQESIDCSFRVLADHIRTLAFSIADGIYPGNEGRNYVLRRILRRAVLFGKKLQLHDGFFSQLADPLIETMGGAFPELVEHAAVITKVLQTEEKAFERTLGRGLQLVDKLIAQKATHISGELLFNLYDTFGFPIDLTQLIAKEHALTVDLEGFEACMQAQKQRARNAHQSSVVEVVDAHTLEGTTVFTGYDPANLIASPATVLYTLSKPEGTYVITDTTPFYAEMGGQVGDQGVLAFGSQSIQILNTLKHESGLVLHIVASIPDDLVAGTPVVLTVDIESRLATERHHTATHLLHWALGEVLGKHVRQAGSLVSPTGLRFDFAHYESITAVQLQAIETLINRRILENHSVGSYEVPFSQKPAQCKAFFEDTYGDTVRVVDIAGYSMELCGGTHVRAIGEIGLFKLQSESSIAAGVRRIEAVAGMAAYSYVQTYMYQLKWLAEQFSCSVSDVTDRVLALQQHKAQLEATLDQLKQKALAHHAQELKAQAKTQAEFNCLIELVTLDQPQDLKPLVLQVLNQLKPGIVILVSVDVDAQKIQFAAACTAEAIQAGHRAGQYIQRLASAYSGKGGGKDDYAMGGAKLSPELEPVLQQFKRELGL